MITTMIGTLTACSSKGTGFLMGPVKAWELKIGGWAFVFALGISQRVKVKKELHGLRPDTAVWAEDEQP